jgi:hypothetical protein
MSLQIEINIILGKNVATGFEEEYFPREYTFEKPAGTVKGDSTRN